MDTSGSPEPPHSPSASVDSHHRPPHGPGALASLVLGATGIVFGDIGTSPLYALQECVGGPHGVSVTPGNVLGVLSLIVWALFLVVTFKYLTVLMRADNHGEGGILALLALVPENLRAGAVKPYLWVVPVTLAGAALLYGDGIVTPAISVLSALEGLSVITKGSEYAVVFEQAVVPATCLILVALFSVQSRGTGHIGRFFGPIMVVWFAAIGVIGAWHVAHHTAILAAFSPVHAARFFLANGWHGVRLLGAVVLVVTGGEALYADMGHFGARPIRIAWIWLVLPALLLSYLGQGSLMLDTGHNVSFFEQVPAGWPVVLLVALATPATVIASQALISGVFSLTHQAVQLGYFPRVEIRHTSGESEGQVYVPSLNRILAVGCIALVLSFQASSKLAAAYGLAVSGTMLITTLVFAVVTHRAWHWPTWKTLALTAFFLSFDVPFVGANLVKFVDGGYVPVLVGSGFFVTMFTWRLGRQHLGRYFSKRTIPLDLFVKTIGERTIARIPGTAVFLASASSGTPPTLIHHVKHNRVVHETVVLLTLASQRVPVVHETKRITFEAIGNGFARVVYAHGFMERPDVPAVLRHATSLGHIECDPETVTYYVGRETLVVGPAGEMWIVAERVFAFMSRNAQRATAYFKLPSEQVVELGAEIDL